MALQQQANVLSFEQLGASLTGDKKAELNRLLSRLRNFGTSSIALGLATSFCDLLTSFMVEFNILLICKMCIVLLFALINGLCSVRAAGMQPFLTVKFARIIFAFGIASLVLYTILFNLNIMILLFSSPLISFIDRSLQSFVLMICFVRLFLSLLLLLVDIGQLITVSNLISLHFKSVGTVYLTPYSGTFAVNQPLATVTVGEASVPMNRASQQPEMEVLTRTAFDDLPTYEAAVGSVAPIWTKGCSAASGGEDVILSSTV